MALTCAKALTHRQLCRAVRSWRDVLHLAQSCCGELSQGKSARLRLGFTGTLSSGFHDQLGRAEASFATSSEDHMAERVSEDCPATLASPRAEKRNGEADLTESDPNYIIDNLHAAEPDESDADSLVFTPGKADRATLMEQSESDSHAEWTETSSGNLEPDLSRPGTGSRPPVRLSMMTSLWEATALTAGVRNSPMDVAQYRPITPIGSEEGRFMDLRPSSRSSGLNDQTGAAKTSDPESVALAAHRLPGASRSSRLKTDSDLPMTPSPPRHSVSIAAGTKQPPD